MMMVGGNFRRAPPVSTICLDPTLSIQLVFKLWNRFFMVDYVEAKGNRCFKFLFTGFMANSLRQP